MAAIPLETLLVMRQYRSSDRNKYRAFIRSYQIVFLECQIDRLKGKYFSEFCLVSKENTETELYDCCLVLLSEFQGWGELILDLI